MDEWVVDLANENKVWNNLVIAHKPQIMLVLNKIRPLYSKYLTAAYLALSTYRLFGGTILYEGEIQEIADILGISFAECLLFQLTYEACAACTSAIVDVDGELHHVRTMDWDLPELKAITVRIKVMCGKNHLFDAITWAGFVGIFTGIKPDRYTISLNYRRTDGAGGIFENLKMLTTGAYPNAYLIREVLTNDVNVVKSIKHANLVSPAYYIILSRSFAGVIIRDRKGYQVKSSSGPYVQTNCDEIGVGDNILYSYERLAYMKTSYDSLDSLIEHVSKFPVCNEETIYTVIMTPKRVQYFKV